MRIRGEKRRKRERIKGRKERGTREKECALA